MVHHGLASTDNRILVLVGGFQSPSCPHGRQFCVRTALPSLSREPRLSNGRGISGSLTVNVQFNSLIFYLTAFVRIVLEQHLFQWHFLLAIWNFCGYIIFFFLLPRIEGEKTLVGEMLSVKKKRFILYRQQSILCNVADIEHFGGKSGNVFPIIHRDSCS